MVRLSLALFIVFFLARGSKAKEARISEVSHDLSKTSTIKMTVGRSTVVDFPCEISHATLGLTDDIKIKVGPDSKKTMTIWLSGASSQPTNLSVKCEGEMYIFDILPSTRSHQDYIVITDSFDQRRRSHKKLVASSLSNSKPLSRVKGKLVASSAIPETQPSTRSDHILQRLNRGKSARKLISKGRKK